MDLDQIFSSEEQQEKKGMIKKDKWLSLIIVAVFFLAIFIPLLGAIWAEDKGLSYTEKRKLAQLPDFPEKPSAIKNYIVDFEKYYNDQFGLRSFYLQSFAGVKRLLGDEEIGSSAKNVGSKNTIKGKEGWYFLNRKWDGDPVADYRNLHLYSETELLKATLLLAARVDWLKELGIEYLLFFAPNKHTVYSEYLPDYIVKEGDISSWDQLNDALSRYTNVQFVDLRKTMQEGKAEAAMYFKDGKEKAALYYTKDSHWNGAGADIAQYAIAEKVAQMFPGQIVPAKRPLEDFIMRRFAGDITRIMGSRKKDSYGPHLTSGTCTSLIDEDYHRRRFETGCDNGSLTALIFHDSFFPAIGPYFADYFNRTVFRWQRMTKAEVVKQIGIKKPDIIIEQRAERHLPFTPDIKNEVYSDFFGKHWEKWKKTIFTLDLRAAAVGKYQSNNVKLKSRGNKKALRMEALTNDPMLFLTNVGFRKNHLYLVKAKLTSSADTALQLFYSVAGQKDKYPSAKYSVSVPIKKGKNSVFLPLFHMDLAAELRFDPGKKEGVYQIEQLEIKQLSEVHLN